MTTRAGCTLLLAIGFTLLLPPSTGHAQALTVYATGIASGCADIEFDSAGNLYATGGAGGLGKIYKVPPGGGAATVITSAGLFYPWGLAMSPGGTLYVVDRGDQTLSNPGRILSVSPTGVLTLFKSGLESSAFIVFDAAGNIYSAVYSLNKVVKITPAGVVSLYASGLGVPGEQVFQLSFDPAGNLYAGVEQDIYKIGPGGSPVTKVISGGLHEAMGHFRTDGDGFYVANYGFHQLVYATPSAAPVNLLTPSGCTTTGSLFDGVLPATASMFQPTGIRVRGGTLFVGDYGCHNVRSFDLPWSTPARHQTWGRIKTIYR